jgi:CHAT domain-containing protein
MADRQYAIAADRLARSEELARLVGLATLSTDVALQTAQLALDRDSAGEALPLATHARAEAERAGLLDRMAEADRIMAQANARLGNPEVALAAAERALAHVENARASLQDPALRAGFLEQRQDLYALAVQLALELNRPGEAFVLAERSRSRAFLDLLGTASLSKGHASALAQEESAMRARLASAALAGQEDSEGEGDAAADAKAARDRVAAVEREYQAFLQRVRAESGEQASLMAVEPVTVAEIQALLPPGSVLVEYLLSGGELVIWVLDGTSVHVRRQRLDRDALAAEVRDFRAAIASRAPLEQVEARAKALYQTLLAPVRAEIRDRRVVIVPHDILHYLPFAALRTPEGAWFVEAHTFTTVPSASVLKFLVDKGSKVSDRVLAVGNPDLGPALELRYAEREVRLLGEKFPKSTVLVRADASERHVKQRAGEAGLLHFAVHGELNEADPMASALLLAPGEGEDGRFEVREIFSTELSAKLVVLSACETGLGKLSRGDELVGLQRAFLYAGTPAVVTTLWKVDDRASFLLMRSFYDALAGTGPAEALRAAQRALIVHDPHPFAWAGYGLTGAPR